MPAFCTTPAIIVKLDFFSWIAHHGGNSQCNPEPPKPRSSSSSFFLANPRPLGQPCRRRLFNWVQICSKSCAGKRFCNFCCPAVFWTVSKDAAVMSQTRRAALINSSHGSNHKGRTIHVHMLVWTLPSYSFLLYVRSCNPI